MAISTPSKFGLNFRGLDGLNAELAKWEGIQKTSFGADLVAVTDYVNAVRAERDQRAAQYGEGIFGTIAAGFTAPFEALGGTGGAGAPGVIGEASTAVVDTASGFADWARKYSFYILGAVVLIVGFAVWLRFKK